MRERWGERECRRRKITFVIEEMLQESTDLVETS